ncbi:hypothetical protein [Streptomyces fructofermentans]
MIGDSAGTAAAVTGPTPGPPPHRAPAAGDPAAWQAFDEDVRSRCMVPAPSPPFGAPPADDLSRLAVALCHRDGRVREAAVRDAAGRPDLLPLIAVRCADWVAPVRQRARQVLRETLDADTAVALAPLILRVGRRGRGEFGVGLLREVLDRAPRARLDVLLADPDRTVRRFGYRIAVEQGVLAPAELAATASRDDDVVVQDLCATAALAAVGDGDGATEDAVLVRLLGARTPRTRAAGVTALRRAGRAEGAGAFLDDRAAQVRACARYVVRQAGGDPAAWYRTRCSGPDAPEPSPGAVIGLAECGERADGALLWPLVRHAGPGIRAAAVAGLRTLDVARADGLLPLLDDPAPRVTRETVAALLPSAGGLPAGWLMERTAADRPRHVRAAAFRLLVAGGGAAALRAAVALLADPDERLRARAGQAVLRWRPSAGAPQGDSEVGELLDLCRHVLGDDAVRRRKWEAGLPR